MLMKFYSITAVTLLFNIIAGSVHAHHGINGQFDQSKSISVTGVITDIRFVNPHSYVYFDVTNDAGSVDAWRCELASGSNMRRNGWTTSLFETGSSITIDGLPARREEFGCFSETITFENGLAVGNGHVFNQEEAPEVVAAVAFEDGIPNISGNWVAERRERQAPNQGATEGGMGQQGMAQAMGGGMAMGGGGGRGPSYSQTELGLSESQGFNREMNPRFHCQATNIFHDWNFNEQVNSIEQNSETIVMTYGFMDIVRTIHLDLNSHPNNITPSRGGHSIGKWDGDTLVVDTIGFLPGYLAATFNGIKHGENLHTVERISLSEDGKTLTREYTVNDPDYLTAPYQGSDSVMLTNADYQPYNCEDLTEEIVEGF